MKTLFSIRGFIPYLIILVFNATVDIGHKITIQNVLLKSYEGETLIVLTALINAMILLPFILLFSPSGYLSDRFAKTKVIRYAALSSIVMALLITFSYSQGWFVIAFALTFLLAIQSAIYSPAKYGLIKELVGIENLGTANGIIQALTIVAILLSSILFSVIFEQYYIGDNTPHLILQNIVPIGWILVAFTIMESYLAFKLPIFEPSELKEKFEPKRYFNLDYLKSNLRLVRSNRNIWLSIFGLSIFWGVGQLVIAAFPAHYKTMTGDENAIIIQAILAVSALGIVIGSLIAGRISKLHIEVGIVPLAAIGLFASLLSFAFSSQVLTMGLSSILFGFFGGLFIVPLNATIQFFAKESEMGIVLAGNNFVQNCIMVLFLLLSIVFVQLGFDSVSLFLMGAFITLVGSFYAMRELPNLFGRILMFPFLRTGYKLSVKGLANLPQQGGVLLLGNHVSWIDWLVLQIASPRTIKFVMDKNIYNRWYLRWFLKNFNIIPISSASSRGAIAQIRERLDNGEVVALFPEGSISYNGQLGTFKKGFELAIHESDHPIVPFYLHGLWGSTFSRADEHYKALSKGGSKREIVVSFGQQLTANATAQQVKQAVATLAFETWESSITKLQPLQHHWLTRAKAKLRKRSIVDTSGQDLSNASVVTTVLLFIKALKSPLKKQNNIGVLLPSSAVGSIVNMALLVLGKRPVNLNYTLNADDISADIAKAEIHTIISSKKFMEKLSDKGFNFPQTVKDKVITVESIKASFGKRAKFISLIQAYLMPAWLIKICYFKSVSLDDTAIILFSNRSKGTPKCVELTHKNLMANIKQISALLNFQDRDVILNSLPIFHSFGLTVTTLLPLCEGITMASAPDPTDAVAIGKLAARYHATIMFGTSTFFHLYEQNHKLHPLMFENIRMVVAGAETLKPEIKQAFKEKFALDIFEGYGTTETAPVISVNMPDRLDIDTMRPIIGNKAGSVGQAIPGTIVKIVDPDTMEELPLGTNGLIIVGGSQVMRGYFNDPEKTAEVIVEINSVRYYKTGDKGHLDEDGFIFIVDRYSRFSKVGANMLNLGNIGEK
jgi:acyl-[acyl-carrier-protein]-phospholipid O-acyltransferase/long-chain-fatty-acid--[acyl-carrier-protein] ligase